MNNEFLEKSRCFIYRNARPIDLARWKYHFENGGNEDVLNALACYQNEDGGFGHVLESDSWNPNSSPVQTWAAACILREIGFNDCEHPIIQGILKYLASGRDFIDGEWLNTVPTNNDYPHAIWWEYRDGLNSDYNPTASLAGFVIRFAPHDSEIYKLGCKTVKEAFNWYVGRKDKTDFHVLRCFIEMLEYCEEAEAEDLIDLTALKSKLKADVKTAICAETEKWATDYVCKPSHFFNSKKSMFYEENRETAEYECQFILDSRLADGSYPITWQWHNDYKEFEISANWWKSDIIIKNFLYLREFGKI